jgi:hypothetical protein
LIGFLFFEIDSDPIPQNEYAVSHDRIWEANDALDRCSLKEIESQMGLIHPANRFRLDSRLLLLENGVELQFLYLQFQGYPNHYELLDVPQSASAMEICRSFRKLLCLASVCPNRESRQLSALKKRFRYISAAYETLSNPRERQRYDELLKLPQQPLFL